MWHTVLAFHLKQHIFTVYYALKEKVLPGLVSLSTVTTQMVWMATRFVLIGQNSTCSFPLFMLSLYLHYPQYPSNTTEWLPASVGVWKGCGTDTTHSTGTSQQYTVCCHIYQCKQCRNSRQTNKQEQHSMQRYCRHKSEQEPLPGRTWINQITKNIKWQHGRIQYQLTNDSEQTRIALF